MAELKRSASTARRRSFPSPRRWSCPAHSSSVRGDMRKASGASEACAEAGTLNSDRVDGVDFRLIKIPRVAVCSDRFEALVSGGSVLETSKWLKCEVPFTKLVGSNQTSASPTLQGIKLIIRLAHRNARRDPII